MERQRIEDTVKGLTAPLRDELAQIEKELAHRLEQVAELRDAKAYVQGVLRRIDPQAAKPKAATKTKGVKTPERLEREAAVREFVAQLATPFTTGSVLREMREQGLPTMSQGNVREVVQELHATGVIRANKKLRGGATEYVTVNGGSNGTQPS